MWQNITTKAKYSSVPCLALQCPAMVNTQAIKHHGQDKLCIFLHYDKNDDAKTGTQIVHSVSGYQHFVPTGALFTSLQD